MNPNIALLAQHAYPIVRRWKISNRATRTPITYGERCGMLDEPFTGLDPRSPLLAGALGWICDRCRAVGVPALSAIVVNAATRRPGPGYYPAAHGKQEEEGGAIDEWKAEFDRVWRSKHPPLLP